MRAMILAVLVVAVAAAASADPYMATDNGNIDIVVDAGKDVLVQQDGQAAQSVFDLFDAVDDKANTADVAGVVEAAVDSALGDSDSSLAQQLATKANRTLSYSKSETYSRPQVDSLSVGAINEFNSQPCSLVNLGALRVHSVYGQTQLCLETDVPGRYAWQAVGCDSPCAACSVGTSGCTQSLSLGGDPDILHMSFEKNLFDASGSNNNGILLGNSTNGQSLYSTARRADGLYSAQFDGTNDYIQLSPMSIGGALTVCAYVQFTTFSTFSRIIDFGNGPNQDNIIFANYGGTNGLHFAIGGARLDLDDFWRTAQGAFVEGCIRVNASGVMSAFANGRLMGQNLNGVAPPTKLRTSNFVGKSNFGDNDALFRGYIDNLRIWSRALSDEEIWQATCTQATSKLDCSGLLMHLTFDQLSLADRSPSKWQGTLSNPNGNNVWVQDGQIGAAFGLDGDDDYAFFATRTFGGDMSLCAWTFTDSIGKWSRVIAFGSGPNRFNLDLANRDSTTTLYFRSTNNILEIANFWRNQEWMHVCVTTQMVDTQAKQFAYRNGQLIGERNATDTVTVTARTQNYIGRSNWEENDNFQGKIDDVRVYTYGLSTSEVASIYSQAS